MNDNVITDGKLETITVFSSQQADDLKDKYRRLINMRRDKKSLIICTVLFLAIMMFSTIHISAGGAIGIIGYILLVAVIEIYLRGAIANGASELKQLYPALLVTDDTSLRFKGEPITLKSGLYPLEQLNLETLAISGTGVILLRSELGQLINIDTATLLN